jgi:hypothetical protein
MSVLFLVISCELFINTICYASRAVPFPWLESALCYSTRSQGNDAVGCSVDFEEKLCLLSPNIISSSETDSLALSENTSKARSTHSQAKALPKPSYCVTWKPGE